MPSPVTSTVTLSTGLLPTGVGEPAALTNMQASSVRTKLNAPLLQTEESLPPPTRKLTRATLGQAREFYFVMGSNFFGVPLTPEHASTARTACSRRGLWCQAPVYP